MRHVGFIALALVAVACGPDPNARLPGSPAVVNNGGAVSSSGGDAAGGQGAGGVGAGGATQSNGGSVGSGGKSGGGGAAGSPFDTGGAAGSSNVGKGGGAGSSPFDTGGAAGSSSGGKAGGGAVGSGGVSSGGGTTGRGGSGGGTTIAGGFTFPEGPEPCTPTMKDVSGGQSGQLGEGAACFRTADEISDWSCSGADDRTVKVNGTEVTKCGAAVKKAGSFFYFEFSAGTNAWASVSWWCSSCGGPGARAVPSCGHYPPWESGATVAPCADGGATTSTPGAAVDGGN